MLQFSFSTVLMALLASNVIAVLIAIPFLKKDFTPCFGYKFLSCFIALALLRLLLPVEFPFTDNIPLPQWLSRMTVFVRQPRIHVIGIGISFWNLFELVWAAGIILKLVSSTRSHRRAWNYVSRMGIDKTEDPKYKLILDDICREHRKPNNFRVIELRALAVPIIWDSGKPCIILPEAMELPPDKLRYALYHEAQHYFRHDFLVKKAIHVLAVIYWWNPACALLHKRANLLLEMYVDRAVTEGKPEIIQEYTECLLFIKKQALRVSSQLSASCEECASPLIRSRDNELERRIAMLMKKPSAFQKASANFAFTALILLTLAWSHRYTLETAYYPTAAEDTAVAEDAAVVDPTEENTYFIMDEFSHYQLYINNIYIDTVTDLEFYPEGIKIYNQKGELIGET